MADAEPVADLIGTFDDLDGGRFEIRRTEFPPGTSTGWHLHNGWQTGLLMRGELTHVTADVTKRVRSGDALVEPPGVVHVATSTGDEDAALLYVAHIPAGALPATPSPPVAAGSKVDDDVSVPLGAPASAYVFSFADGHDAAPVRVGIVICRQNGTYSMLSPDGDRGGLVVEARIAGQQTVLLAPWPSREAPGEAVVVSLRFENEFGTFTAAADEGDVERQWRGRGFFDTVPLPPEVDVPRDWTTAQAAYSDVLERLSEMVARTTTLDGGTQSG